MFLSLSLLPLCTAFYQQSPTSQTRRIQSLQQATATLPVLDDANFRQVLDDDDLVLVDIYAPWCGPCQVVESVLLAASPDIPIFRFNVDNRNPDFKTELFLQDALPRALPSLILFSHGQVVHQWSGILNRQQLDEFLVSATPTTTTTTKQEPPEQSGYVRLMKRTADEYYMLSEQ